MGCIGPHKDPDAPGPGGRGPHRRTACPLRRCVRKPKACLVTRRQLFSKGELSRGRGVWLQAGCCVEMTKDYRGGRDSSGASRQAWSPCVCPRQRCTCAPEGAHARVGPSARLYTRVCPRRRPGAVVWEPVGRVDSGLSAQALGGGQPGFSGCEGTEVRPRVTGGPDGAAAWP